MWVNLFVGDPDGPNKFRWIYISLCFSSQCIVAESCIVQDAMKTIATHWKALQRSWNTVEHI